MLPIIKTNRPSPPSLFALFLIGLLASSCHSIPKSENTAPSTVMLLMGNARSIGADRRSARALKSGDVIQEPETWLQTADLGHLYLYLGEKIRPPNTSYGGGIYDPAIRPANLLLLNDNSTLQLKKVSRELSTNKKTQKEQIVLALYNGMIRGNVKTNSAFQVYFTNGVFLMEAGVFGMDSTGNVALLDGRGEIRMSSRGITNVLTANQKFDAETGSVTNFITGQFGHSQHDIWLPSDPMYIPWSQPESTKSPYTLPPNRPF
jgi:hypothetical protein